MKIMFIRHGEPDYPVDNLTDKGKKEAELLCKRFLQSCEIDDVYCSPLGRAIATAKPYLEATGKTAIVKRWLQEFNAKVWNEKNGGGYNIPWDFYPADWTGDELLFDKYKWTTSPLMNQSVVDAYADVCKGIDELLSSYGYNRSGNMYLSDEKDKDKTIVIFCHLGAQFAILSHLLGISAVLLWHGFFVAPTSITTLVAEERNKGEAYFRVTSLGDTCHLYVADEPISHRGLHEYPPVKL